jgi:hypothetical protein
LLEQRLQLRSLVVLLVHFRHPCTLDPHQAPLQVRLPDMKNPLPS